MTDPLDHDTWDPAVYELFRAERDRPVDDLLELVGSDRRARVLDLGCGTGELTVRLHRQVGAERTVGVDRSAAMLAAAPHESGVTFVGGDLATHTEPDGVDLVFANASLQWLPDDHPGLFAHLWSQLREGGRLAVQVPANFEHPSHVVADDLGQEYGLEPLARAEAILSPEEYSTLLHDLGAIDEHVRLVVYGVRLARTDDVITWVGGSLLTHYRRELGDRFSEFEAEYRSRLLAELGDPDGSAPYYFPFPRILMVADKP